MTTASACVKRGKADHHNMVHYKSEDPPSCSAKAVRARQMDLEDMSDANKDVEGKFLNF